MSKRVGNVIIFEAEPEDICQECSKPAETRPYGKGGKRICYECGMKDEAGTEKRMGEVLFGDKPSN